MKIKLGISSLNKAFVLQLDYEANFAMLNNNPINLDVKKFTNKLLRIVSSWDKVMIDKNVLDGIEYFVNIQKDGKNYKYKGQNKFSTNYNEFIALLQEYELW